MKIILALLAALGFIDLCVIATEAIYVSFCGYILTDIDFVDKNNDSN